ncbi:hypothetical protein [Chitinimonas sp.]|uniref:hypothetical protein n=1 Tax=Chitinimonas sp. TaxID=1934313 RepID=UPI0035AF106E
MQRRSLLALMAASLLAPAVLADVAAPKVAVTDLAYTQAVSQYFEAAELKSNTALSANRNGMAMSDSTQLTYVAGTYSYLEQRELGSFTNDIKGALIKGSGLRLVQGKGFDAGAPQPTKAEQVLNQMKTGKIAKPVRQPEVKDIIARIKKGEFNGADYVLFGTLSNIQFIDQLSPLQGSTSAAYQFGLDLVADFSLINTKTFEIKAAFSAQGSGNETKILSNRGDHITPNRGKVMRETSQTLAANVYEQLIDQLGVSDPNVTRRMRTGASNANGQQQNMQVTPINQEPVTILR